MFTTRNLKIQQRRNSWENALKPWEIAICEEKEYSQIWSSQMVMPMIYLLAKILSWNTQSTIVIQSEILTLLFLNRGVWWWLDRSAHGYVGSKLIPMVLVRMIVLWGVEVLSGEQKVSGWGDFPNSWENVMLL